ncbi:MAG: DegT/DnrJ/EryC1/StrS family aminotransferase [Bacteroidota bacterium]
MHKIPFSPPRIDAATIDAVREVLESGWITTGPVTKSLEKEVAELSQIPRALCVSSATMGLELLLRWLGVGEGDEVIIPAYTYCATANVVLHCGARPVMVDVLPDTLTIDPEQVAAAITERTKVIVPVDLGGLPADYLDLWRIIESEEVMRRFRADNEVQEQLGRIALIADAAHSIGARYRGRSAASWCDAAVFSFHAVKNIATAEGGAICFNMPAPFDNDQLYQLLNVRSLHGQSKDALAKLGTNAWEYDVVEAGYKCNMPDVLAAMGLVEIRRYREDTLPRRRQIMEQYVEALENYDRAELPHFHSADKESSCHLFLLRIRDISLEERNNIIRMIFALGVSVNVHYKPLPLLTVYKKRGYRMEDFPVARDAWHREITLPVYYDLSEANVGRVVSAVVQSTERETLPLIIPSEVTE